MAKSDPEGYTYDQIQDHGGARIPAKQQTRGAAPNTAKQATRASSTKSTWVLFVIVVTFVSGCLVWYDERLFVAVANYNKDTDYKNYTIHSNKTTATALSTGQAEEEVDQQMDNYLRANQDLLNQVSSLTKEKDDLVTSLNKEKENLEMELKRYREKEEAAAKQQTSPPNVLVEEAQKQEGIVQPNPATTPDETQETTPDVLSASTLHSYDEELLNLQRWEMDSLLGLRKYKTDPNLPEKEDNDKLQASCQPPPGVSPSCCFGSFSAGGTVGIRDSRYCHQSFSQLGALKGYVQQFLRDHPVNSTTDNGDAAPACDACRIVELARANNLRKIGFLGDSVHSQSFEGLSCELQRRNYRVTETNFTEYHMEGFWRRKPLSTKVLEVTSPAWNAGDKVVLQLDILYQFPVAEAAQSWFRSVLESTDVLVLGLGLHYSHLKHEGFGNFESVFVENMMDLLHSIIHNSTVRLLLHRETSATHFDAANGAFQPWMLLGKDPNATIEREKCVPLWNGHFPWREVAWQKAIREDSSRVQILSAANLPATPPQPREFITLPFYGLTQSLHSMHPFHSHPMDCCHYCSSPYLFLTVWRSIRLAMDRQYA